MYSGSPAVQSVTVMATANSNASTGFHSVEDTSIINATIDNENFHYWVHVALLTNDNIDDVRFIAIDITYDIIRPLP